MTPKEVINFSKENKVCMIDFKFTDLLGTWQHFSIPMSEFNVDLFEDGLGFDGSSIRGWKAIHESDMLIMPDAKTAKMDPFCNQPTLSLVGDVVDPITKEGYVRDPRAIAKNAEEYLKSLGFADTCYVGPEAEFFIFDDVRFDQSEFNSFYSIDSVEAHWNTGSDIGINLGHKVRQKGGYFPVAPTDHFQDLRTEMVQELEKVGIQVERQHHEVGTAGQAEIDVRFDSLLSMADKQMWFKYIIKNVAKRNGKTVTFMPKPIYGENGSGMHTHQSLWKGSNPLFAGDKYAGVSEMCLHYIGGILKHAPALVALTNPSTNSYKRLVPGYEAPIKLAYSSRNRSAAVRIPMYSQSPKAKRIEFRTPDPSCNPYIAFAAMLMAGLDGIKNKIDPGQPLDKNIYGLSPQELAEIRSIPASLEESLENLRNNHEFLLAGNVFTTDVVNAWIDYKMDEEVSETRLRPSATEFSLYYDC
ncbi:type I glutamate--ammonia ligase [bacterium K02(2017)]|nr:type I glutamate--ammonia ligase [bacterium K02(2017)]